MPRPTPLQSRAAAAPSPAAETESTLRFSPLNLAVLGAGLASILGGFMMLGAASTVGAPLLLMLGFAVLVPLGLIL